MVGIGAFARARGRRRAYYSPAMEAARPRTRGRRLRRGTVERPLNARLVRVGFLVVVPAILAFLFSISTTGALPRSPLDPLFDAESAATFAEAISVEYPSRVPGSEGAAEAARWYRETVGSLGSPDRGGRLDGGRSPTSARSSFATSSRSSRDARRRRSSSLLIATTPERTSRSARTRPARRRSSSSRAASRRRSSGPIRFRSTRSFSCRPTQARSVGPVQLASSTTSPLARSAIAVVVLDDLGRGAPDWRSRATGPCLPRARSFGQRPHGSRRRSASARRFRPSRRSSSTSACRSRSTSKVDSSPRELSAVTLTTDGRPQRRRWPDTRNRDAPRSARPCDRGARQLARHERRWRVSHTRQPLLRRPRCERMDARAWR